MSQNSTNNSNYQYIVKSKYFSSSPVMDESLSEFKEKKSGFTGPKNTQKPVVNKKHTKKAPKIKGQKDIRTALKSKKSDLLAYAKDFDVVCRKSGIDVDTEQLQLAIALSKSVESPGNDCSTQESKPLSSQERTKRIRTTLQEYGFTVPEIKITSKRQKRRVKKSFKLLLASTEEKQQIVSDKYSQILLQTICETEVKHSENSENEIKCYNLATSVSYMTMKDNGILYVDNLVEKSSSNGCLLRDWSKIPGRPQSPKNCETITMNFSEIECSQEELDIVLSGTLKSAKSIVQNKAKALGSNPPIVIVENIIDNELTNLISKTEDTVINKSPKILADESLSTTLTDNNAIIIGNNFVKMNNSYQSDRLRSCSPDIFDDEVSAEWDTINSCTESSKSGVKEANKYVRPNDTPKSNNAEPSSDCVLDLTEINENNDTNSNSNHCFKVPSMLSQKNNCTKRISSDFMEITECVAVLDGNTKTKLSQIKNNTRRMTNDLMEMTECVNHVSVPHIQENIDLTQEHENNLSNVVKVSNIVDDKVVDLSQSSNSEDELPFVKVSGSNQHSLDDTILVESDEIMVYNRHEILVDEVEVVEKPNTSNNVLTSASGNLFVEFKHNHSETDDTASTKVENNFAIDFTQGESMPYKIHNETEVDLTQSSDSLDNAEDIRSNKSIINTPVKSSLGRKDDISVDYDDLFDNVITDSTSKTDGISEQSLNYVSDKESHSQNSEVFNISDKEFEYSINQSRSDLASDVNFGGISVIDNNISGVADINPDHNTDSLGSPRMSDCHLPTVNIKKSFPVVKKHYTYLEFHSKHIDNDDKGLSKEIESKSHKALKENEFTPTSSKFIVKTDQVTPMLDYASMSTPERNRELDKYGLKPFKRKRAIQLLTHLYNQTHPIVETCPEDLPSPSKKRRYSSQPTPKTLMDDPDNVLKSPSKSLKSPSKYLKSPLKGLKSPNKCLKSPNKGLKSPNKGLKSPNKGMKSPSKSLKCSKNQTENYMQPDIYQGIEERNLYEVTNELPAIKEIHCSEEDWVFQKREKSKLHACRVPLHIALHNFVSCRRRLREAILKYEPVNIDVIHKELVATGHRYDPKDLLKYMDKKCITVKTADNNGRNKRR